MSFCDDIGNNCGPLSNLCHVVYATKGRIENLYMVSEPDPAIPQQRSIQKSTEPPGNNHQEKSGLRAKFSKTDKND